MKAHTILLPFATEQARKCYESHRQGIHDKGYLRRDPDYWDKVGRLARVRKHFSAGDYLAGQHEAIEFAKMYDTQMPRILVEFTDMCQAFVGWINLQS